MVFDRAMYKENARRQLSGKWGAAMAVAVMASIFSLLSMWIPGLGENKLFTLLLFVFSGPLSVASACFFLNVAQNKEASVNDFFSGLSYFLKALAVYVLLDVIIFIGVALFIIPGIIAGLGLSMTSYIVANNPNVGVIDALKLSWKMTKGHKMEIFILFLTLIGWFILDGITLGIANLYVYPYTNTILANVYYALRDDIIDRGEATYEDFGMVAPMVLPSYQEQPIEASMQAIDAQQADYEEEFEEEDFIETIMNKDKEFADVMREVVGEEEAETIMPEQAARQEAEEMDLSELIACIRDDDDADYVPPSR